MEREELKDIEEEAIDILSEDAQAGDKKLLGPDIKQMAGGENFYSHIIYYLTGIEIKESEAASLWSDILKHKYLMSEKLGRNAGIRVAALDYFVNVDGRLKKVTFMDIDKLKKISLDAEYDSLTRVFRKDVLEQKTAGLVENAAGGGHPLSVIFFDVDNFKKYNDALGHLAGDAALYEVAKALRGNFKNIFRFGGDEFVTVTELPKDKAIFRAEKTALEVEAKKFLIKKTDEILTLSFGAATFPEDGGDLKSLLASADRELYRWKRRKKDAPAS